MIFVLDKGRMCNNILQYGHVYAWAREHGKRAVSMRFAYKYRYFHNTDSRPNSIKLGVHVRRGDYIIGAPSTFSLMASMYHDTPVYWMMSDKEDIHFDTFNNMFTHIV